MSSPVAASGAARASSVSFSVLGSGTLSTGAAAGYSLAGLAFVLSHPQSLQRALGLPVGRGLPALSLELRALGGSAAPSGADVRGGLWYGTLGYTSFEEPKARRACVPLYWEGNPF